MIAETMIMKIRAGHSSSSYDHSLILILLLQFEPFQICFSDISLIHI